jgi:hypothetical protein
VQFGVKSLKNKNGSQRLPYGMLFLTFCQVLGAIWSKKLEK